MAANIEPPSDELINSAMAMTEYYDRNVMIQALQAKSNDLEAVMNEWFDDSEKFKRTYSWDETVFKADRDGGDDWGHSQPSFVIQGPDEGNVIHGVAPTNDTFFPPSRPPSRANNISPMSRIVDMATNDFAPSTKQQEDEQLQRALEASMQASGVSTPIRSGQQESGTLPLDYDMGSKHFGPSNRSDYTNEWAMIRLDTNGQDPEPSWRRREPDMPVFFRCRETHNWAQHRVGHILTILHSIPAARNQFLRTGTVPSTGYGNDKDWWKGKPILIPQLQAAAAAGVEADYAAKKMQWDAELHRLTAFLDGSERSYGTADMLAGDGAIDPEKEFFEHLTEEQYDSTLRPVQPPSNPLQSSVAYISVTGGPVLQMSYFCLFDFGLTGTAFRDVESLYGVLDAIFFPDALMEPFTESTNVAVLEETSEVIPMRFGRDDPLQKMMALPETLYIDRYLKANQDKMRQVLRDMNKIIAAKTKGYQMEEKLNKIQDPVTNVISDREQAYTHNIECYRHKINLIKTHRKWLDHEEARSTLKEESGDGRDEFLDEPDEFYYLPKDAPEPKLTAEEKDRIIHFDSLVGKYENALRMRKQRLANVAAQREGLQNVLQHLSTLLTGPSEDPQWNATHEYSLRGVVSSIDTVYLRRRENDLMEIDGGAGPSEQWWKYFYDHNSDGPAIRAEKVTFELVVREAAGAGSKPILLYATEKALLEELLPLADALKTFVKFDNRHFKMELNQESPRETKRSGFDNPSSPTKRNRVRSDSIDSLATNRASVGSVDDDSGIQMDLLSSEGPIEFVDNTESQDDEAQRLPEMQEMQEMQGVPEMQEMQERKHSLGLERGTSYAGKETSILDLPIEVGVAGVQARED